MQDRQRIAPAVGDQLRRAAAALAVLRRELASGDVRRDTPGQEERLAVLGRRLDEVESAMADATALAEHATADLREDVQLRVGRLAEELEAVAEMARVAAATSARAADRRAVEASFDEAHHRIDTLTDELRAAAREQWSGALRARRDERRALAELGARLEQMERDRDAIADELRRGAQSWADERAALQERVAELAAMIVTGPVPGPSAEGDAAGWPSTRAFDQLRIAVEGMRMRLAYHEKEVAELAGKRDLDERLDEIQALLARLEDAKQGAREDRETVLEQLDRVASRLDYRLHQLEATPPVAER